MGCKTAKGKSSVFDKANDHKKNLAMFLNTQKIIFDILSLPSFS